MSRDAVQEAPELLALHRSVLRACLGFVALAGPGASAFILFQGAGEGSNNAVSWGLAIGTLAFPLLWLGQQRLGFRATALLFLALSAAAAFSVRLRGGMGAGPTLLNVMSIVLAALFFGARGAVAGLVANLALLALAGALVLGDVVMTPASSLWDATRPIVWVRTFVLIGFFCGAIAAAVVYVVERLELDARRLREALAREQEERARREATQRALEHSQRLEALGRLAGSIAHDFNNALTVMMGATAFAAEPDCSSEELRGALADISSAVETASQLTQQLLVFGRRDAPKPKPVALGSAVSGFARPLRRMLPPAIQLEVEAELEGSILIDQTQLEQVLLNLVANARDAITGAGRIRIALAAREVAAPPLGWPAARPGRFAVLAVADDGAGMDETVQAHVFEPFFTTKPAGRGTGLGVAIVHAVVERAGGFIELESAPGRGSEFRLLFPLLPPAAASAA